MMRTLTKMKKALVIVAHPDDETIWMGGTILRNHGWKWTIISLCRKDDEDRAPKFDRTCVNYGADGFMGDLDDEKLEPLPEDEVKEKIMSLVPDEEYDFLYTHGENGEYGHLRHKEIHLAVKSLVEEGKLRCKKAFCFSYISGKKQVSGVPGLHIMEPAKEKESIILNNKEYLKKKKIIEGIYGFSPESFESVCCNKRESFKEL